MTQSSFPGFQVPAGILPAVWIQWPPCLFRGEGKECFYWNREKFCNLVLLNGERAIFGEDSHIGIDQGTHDAIKVIERAQECNFIWGIPSSSDVSRRAVSLRFRSMSSRCPPGNRYRLAAR